MWQKVTRNDIVLVPTVSKSSHYEDGRRPLLKSFVNFYNLGIARDIQCISAIPDLVSVPHHVNHQM